MWQTDTSDGSDAARADHCQDYGACIMAGCVKRRRGELCEISMGRLDGWLRFTEKRAKCTLREVSFIDKDANAGLFDGSCRFSCYIYFMVGWLGDGEGRENTNNALRMLFSAKLKYKWQIRIFLG